MISLRRMLLPYLLVTYLVNDCAEAFAFSPLKLSYRNIGTLPPRLSIRQDHRDTTRQLQPQQQQGRSHISTSTLHTAMPDELMYSDAFSVPLLLAFALGVGFAAQTFINQMLEGEQGLGAFLTDGGGFNKSGFRKATKDKDDIKTDPLPWLKLPNLDFVDVAGQDKIMSESELMMKLERLKEGMKTAVEQGRLQEAESIRKELEQTMENYGVEFTSDEA